MIPLSIHLVGDGAFEDTPDMVVGEFKDVAFLEHGTVKGNPTIGLRIKVGDGQYIFAQTTWALYYNSVKAFEARYGAPK